MSTHDREREGAPEELDEVERLLAELASSEAEREALKEAHRQLEKDLFRLADPLPPGDFVSQVMSKVEAAPVPLRLRSELFTASLVLGVTVGLAVTALVATGAAGSSLGLALAQVAVVLREVLVGLGSALSVLWRTAAVPMVAALSMMLALSLYALRRVAAPAKAVRS